MANEKRLDSIEDLYEYTKDWTPEAQASALEAFRRRTSGDVRAWYCTRGRVCDGMPHEGYDYNHARSDQWPPPGKSWFVWALVGGRGSGKTRSGSEYVRQISKHVGRIALIAPTNGDIRNTMIEGESGLQKVFADVGEKIDYKPALKTIKFPSGCQALLFSAEEPERLRGPQHHFAWLDEPAAMPAIGEVWDQLLFGLRLKSARGPHVAVTTTPKPIKWLKAILAEETTAQSKVSTYANLANLDPTVKRTMLDRYEGTRLGRQELHGEVLEDIEGALWQESLIQRSNIESNSCERIVVAIDPAGSTNKRSDETGIMVVGRIGRFAYVLEDGSGKFSPNGWAERAIKLAKKYKADAIVAEKNFGGDMVQSTIESSPLFKTAMVRIIITTAARSKELRAEPVVALYEQHRVFHNGPKANFTALKPDDPSLEDEMVTWVPGQGKSPNRVDALVWGLTEVMGVVDIESQIASPAGRRSSVSEEAETVLPPGRRANGIAGMRPTGSRYSTPVSSLPSIFNRPRRRV